MARACPLLRGECITAACRWRNSCFKAAAGVSASGGQLYLYVFVTVVGWTMFRADSLTQGLMLLKQMFLLRPGIYDTAMYMSHKTIVYMVIGIVLCGPFQALVPLF